MEHFVPPLCRLALVISMAMVMVAPASAQISTPCNTSAISSFFNPCIGFLTNSSGNGTSPTAECCNSVKSLTSGSVDCLCLVVTGSVPFRIPFNRTLAISLPRACNLPGVPVQCKTTGSPIPAPGPASLGPSPSPASSPSAPSGLTPSSPSGLTPSSPSGLTPSLSPQGSAVLPSPVTPSLAPQSDTTPPSVDSGTPSTTTGSGRTNLTPSSAMSSHRLLPSVVLIALGFAVLKHY